MGKRVHLAAWLLVAAAALRFYRLSANPLWLDELIVHDLGRQGVRAILTYSTLGPHPPLYYLLQWLTAGGIFLRTEWAWRWVSALSGALTIPLVYQQARRIASWQSATISSLLLLLAPTHIFFSQEARPYAFVTLLSVLSLYVLERLEARPGHWRSWLWFSLLSLVGLYSSYSYALVVAAHLAYLLLWHRLWRPVVVGGCVLGLATLPLLLTAPQPLGYTALGYATTQPLLPLSVVQYLLVIDPLRYGVYWADVWVPLLVGILLLIGLLRVKVVPTPLVIYCFVQITLPMLLVFGLLLGAFGIRLPLKDAKQFMVLLPSLFILVAWGLDGIRQLYPARLGRLGSLVLFVTLLISALVGLDRYWSISKSPEGEVVRVVRGQARPGDGLIVLHYSLGAASDFYLPEAAAYSLSPQADEEALLLFARTPNGRQALDREEGVVPSVLVTRHPRLWLLRHKGPHELLYQQLLERCTLHGEWSYPPFQAILLDCAPTPPVLDLPHWDKKARRELPGGEA